MRLFFATLILCLTACQYDPHSANYTKTKPKREDLIGSYVPNSTTTNLIASVGYNAQLPASIVLSEDGSLAISNIPDWWGTPFGVVGGGYDSGLGTWRLVQHQDWWSIDVDFQSTSHFSSRNSTGSFLTTFMLVGELPPYTILLAIGDFDKGQNMKFEKVVP